MLTRVSAYFFRPGYSTWRDIVYFAVLRMSFIAKALTRVTSQKLIRRVKYVCMTGESTLWSILDETYFGAFQEKISFVKGLQKGNKILVVMASRQEEKRITYASIM